MQEAFSVWNAKFDEPSVFALKYLASPASFGLRMFVCPSIIKSCRQGEILLPRSPPVYQREFHSSMQIQLGVGR